MGQTFQDGKPFGSDIFDLWLQKDTTTGEYNQLSNSSLDAKSKLDNPKSTGVGAITGSSVLNFWDVTQLVWGFILLILNVIFAIPIALLTLSLPSAIKMFIIVPMVILGLAVVVMGIFGRR
jgi:hypothetical protein